MSHKNKACLAKVISLGEAGLYRAPKRYEASGKKAKRYAKRRLLATASRRPLFFYRAILVRQPIFLSRIRESNPHV